MLMRKMQLAFSAAFALLLAVGIVSYRNNENQVRTEERVVHTQEVLAALAGVLSDETDAVNARRGYFITSDTLFLRKYETSAAAAYANLARVRQLTADNAPQQRRLDALDPLIARRLRLVAQLIDSQGNHPLSVAVQVSTTLEGEELQDRARDLLAEMVGAERVLLESRIAKARASARLAIFTILLGTGLALGLLGAVFYLLQREIAQRSRADEALRASEVKFRGILESAPDAMVIADARGRIALVNAETERLFGYRRDELVGQTVEILVPERFRGRHSHHRQGYAAHPRTRPMDEALDLRGLRKDATEFPAEISLSPLESAEGILVTSAIRDISVRRKAEAHLLKKMEELKRSNEELAQFAYIASHDLQEPLRMVASYTQLLSKRYKGKLDSDADEFISFAVDGASRMQRLIQDLLAYSRAGTNGQALREISSEDALKEALTNLQATMEENGAVVTHDSLPAITTDATQLAQVFQNLVGNAIKYRGPEVPRVHVSATTNGGNEWIFSVRDNGLGIDPQYFERIFILFQRLHGRKEFKGTGIGLAICKKIVERLGGRIWVESQPEKGSTFYFALPEKDGK
jgi:PAS domain S-box-containing protein